MNADSSGIFAATSAPSRYQSAKVVTANECLSPWTCAGRVPELVMPASASSWANTASTRLPESRVPAAERKNAGDDGTGHRCRQRSR
jgi:hypothetical protein